MSGANKKWSQYVCYAVALGTSLVLQLAHPEMFAILCTRLPLEGIFQSQPEGLDLPLNTSVMPKKVID